MTEVSHPGEFETAVVRAVIEIAVEKAVGLLSSAWSSVRSRISLDGEREALLSELFLSAGRHLLVPANDYHPAGKEDHPPAHSLGYPHDVEALRPFLGFSGKVVEEIGEARAEVVAPNDHLIVSGSPKASGVARKFIPSLQVSAGRETLLCETVFALDDLPYSFIENNDRRVKVVSKALSGRAVEKSRKAIRYKTPGSGPVIWEPTAHETSEWLKSDFLLISRLPRTRLGGTLLSVAGGHGAGTEAMRLFVDDLPIEKLRGLQEVLRGHPYYQFLVEVVSVEHTLRGTMPSEVRLVEDPPPQPVVVRNAHLS